jgi:hypothetical protein
LLHLIVVGGLLLQLPRQDSTVEPQKPIDLWCRNGAVSDESFVGCVCVEARITRPARKVFHGADTLARLKARDSRDHAECLCLRV